MQLIPKFYLCRKWSFSPTFHESHAECKLHAYKKGGFQQEDGLTVSPRVMLRLLGVLDNSGKEHYLGQEEL
eukprot:snap_masked-scaffold_26-processed-gene-4.90-mRNA-1 protein AED:1.00 eAED:1.00 QI:0/0/0/0/1/1/3/0/70